MKSKSAMTRNVLLPILIIALLLNPFSFPGNNGVMHLEKTFAASPGWVGANGSKYFGNIANQPYDINVSRNNGDSSFPSLVMDSKDYPCIAWHDNTNGNHDIYFTRWDGNNWVNATGTILDQTNGNVSKNSGASLEPILILDSLDRPNIVWTDNTTGNNEIFFAKWNGNNWLNASGNILATTNGNVSNNTNNSSKPSFSIDSSENPYIAWQEGNSEIFFTRWNGSNWTNASGNILNATNGNVSNNSHTSTNPSLSINSLDNPCIAWDDYIYTISSTEIVYSEWNGSNWTNINGSILNSSNGFVTNDNHLSSDPCLALDSLDNPNIVWSDANIFTGSEDCIYTKWDGQNWVNAQGVLLTTSNGIIPGGLRSWDPVLFIDSINSPNVAFTGFVGNQTEICFKYWDGSNWNNIQGQSTNSVTEPGTWGNAYPSLALDSFGNPCIAWYANANNKYEIYFVKWSDNPITPPSWVGAKGSVYQPNNPPLPFDINVSNNTSSSERPIIALDSKDNPHIVWQNTYLGIYNIFYVHWDGNNWVGANGSIYNPASATQPADINVSSGGKQAYYPHLVLDKSDLPHITWSSNSYMEIFYVNWDGNNWVGANGSIYNPASTAQPSDILLNKCSTYINFTPDNALKLDTNGNPHIVWYDNEVKYVHWNGANWVGANGSIFNPSSAIQPFDIDVSKKGLSSWKTPNISFELDSMNHPHIAWMGIKTPGFPEDDIYYLQWNGANWVGANGSAYNPLAVNQPLDIYIDRNDGASLNSSYPCLALDKSDQPHLVWHDYSYGGYVEILYIHWAGTNWVGTNGSIYNPLASTQPPDINVSRNNSYSFFPYLKLDQYGNPHIAWQDFSYESTGYFLYVHWNGTDWVGANGSVYNPTSLIQPSDIKVSELKANWVYNPNNFGWVYYPNTFALDNANIPNFACVYRQNKTDNLDILFLKWNGSNEDLAVSITKETDIHNNNTYDDNGLEVNQDKPDNRTLTIKLTVDVQGSVDKLKGAYLQDTIPADCEFVPGSSSPKVSEHMLWRFRTWQCGLPGESTKVWEPGEPIFGGDQQYLYTQTTDIRWFINAPGKYTFTYQVRLLKDAPNQVIESKPAIVVVPPDGFEYFYKSNMTSNQYKALDQTIKDDCGLSKCITLLSPCDGNKLVVGTKFAVRWEVDYKQLHKTIWPDVTTEGVIKIEYSFSKSDLCNSNNWKFFENWKYGDKNLSYKIRNEVGLSVGGHIYIEPSMLDENNDNILDDYRECYIRLSYWDDAVKKGERVAVSNIIKVGITKYPSLNYCKWADPHANDNKLQWRKRKPLIIFGGYAIFNNRAPDLLSNATGFDYFMEDFRNNKIFSLTDNISDVINRPNTKIFDYYIPYEASYDSSGSWFLNYIWHRYPEWSADFYRNKGVLFDLILPALDSMSDASFNILMREWKDRVFNDITDFQRAMRDHDTKVKGIEAISEYLAKDFSLKIQDGSISSGVPISLLGQSLGGVMARAFMKQHILLNNSSKKSLENQIGTMTSKCFTICSPNHGTYWANSRWGWLHPETILYENKYYYWYQDYSYSKLTQDLFWDGFNDIPGNIKKPFYSSEFLKKLNVIIKDRNDSDYNPYFEKIFVYGGAQTPQPHFFGHIITDAISKGDFIKACLGAWSKSNLEYQDGLNDGPIPLYSQLFYDFKNGKEVLNSSLGGTSYYCQMNHKTSLDNPSCSIDMRKCIMEQLLMPYVNKIEPKTSLERCKIEFGKTYRFYGNFGGNRNLIKVGAKLTPFDLNLQCIIKDMETLADGYRVNKDPCSYDNTITWIDVEVKKPIQLNTLKKISDNKLFGAFSEDVEMKVVFTFSINGEESVLGTTYNQSTENIELPVDPPEKNFSLKMWPDKLTNYRNDIVTINASIQNNTFMPSSNAYIVFYLPNDLDFISSNPAGTSDGKKITIRLNELKGYEKNKISFKGRLRKGVIVSEKGLTLNISGQLFLENMSFLSASASVIFVNTTSVEPLLMSIIWSGINTKTSTARKGDEISAKVIPEGGSSPYQITIDWGDGSDKSRKSDVTSDNPPTLTHTYNEAGEYTIIIICTDQYGNVCKIIRKVKVE